MRYSQSKALWINDLEDCDRCVTPFLRCPLFFAFWQPFAISGFELDTVCPVGWHLAGKYKNQGYLQAKRRFNFRRAWDGRQGSNQFAGKLMLRTKEDSLRRVTFHDLASV